MTSQVGAVSIVFNAARADAIGTAQRVAEWARRRGLRIVATDAEPEVLGGGRSAGDVAAGDGELVDAAIAVGGDGTVLRAVRMYADQGVPIVGVNVGYLGYLTRLEPDSAHGFLDLWLDGEEGRDWFYDERTMVQAEVCIPDDAGTERRTRHLALNEFVVEKEQPGQTVRLETTIDGASFVTYVADGLIIATPTGSTAYSLSARGPVVSPKVDCLLLSPVSPHMAFDRSLVIDPREVVQVTVVGQRSVAVAADGQRIADLAPGDVIEFRGAPEKVRFVRFEQMRFHQILRSKFAGGGL